MTASIIPQGKSTVTPYIVVKGAAKFLDFVRDAFNAVERGRFHNPDGTIGHAEVIVGNSVLMTVDAQPEWPDTPAFLSIYLEDADAAIARALRAGASVVTEVATSGILGDRIGRIKDPVGNIWWIQTHLEDVDETTIRERFQDSDELATMQRLAETFNDEMSRRRAASSP